MILGLVFVSNKWDNNAGGNEFVNGKWARVGGPVLFMDPLEDELDNQEQWLEKLR